jgi:hypothetical protein
MSRKLNQRGLKAAVVAYEAEFPDAAEVTLVGLKAGLRAYVKTLPTVYHLGGDEIISRYTMELIAMGCPEEEANAIKRRVEKVLDALSRKRAPPVARDARKPEAAQHRALPKPKGPGKDEP